MGGCQPFTFRNEETFLALDAQGNPQTPEEEYEQFIRLGVDGFFSDFTQTSKKVRDRPVISDPVEYPYLMVKEAEGAEGAEGAGGEVFWLGCLIMVNHPDLI